MQRGICPLAKIVFVLQKHILLLLTHNPRYEDLPTVANDTLMTIHTLPLSQKARCRHVGKSFDFHFI